MFPVNFYKIGICFFIGLIGINSFYWINLAKRYPFSFQGLIDVWAQATQQAAWSTMPLLLIAIIILYMLSKEN